MGSDDDALFQLILHRLTQTMCYIHCYVCDLNITGRHGRVLTSKTESLHDNNFFYYISCVRTRIIIIIIIIIIIYFAQKDNIQQKKS